MTEVNLKAELTPAQLARMEEQFDIVGNSIGVFNVDTYDVHRVDGKIRVTTLVGDCDWYEDLDELCGVFLTAA